ncbi:hypothetical protein KH5_23820 [Urechidicola sp. KH5]
MKKLAVLFLFSVFSMGLNAQETVVADGPIFKFDEEVIDYGKIEKGSDGHRVFTFTNVGNAPLIIEKVKGSCGCTVPTKPEGAVMPGEKGEIKVKYDTNRIGGFSKTVTITSNATEPLKRIKIKGIVLKPDESAAIEREKNILSNN